MALVQGSSTNACITDDLHNGDHGPYTPTIVTTSTVPATEDSLPVPEQTTVETVMNMTPENRAHFDLEKSDSLILSGIGDEIYSTVDACKSAHEMWEAIKGYNKYLHETLQTYQQTTSELTQTPETKNVDTTPRYKNDNQTGQFGNQRAVNVVGLGKTVGVLALLDSPDMCDICYSDDQNDVECDDERVALANLIANLKLDVDENKKIQKQLKKANATLTQELTECKSILAETSRTLGESNSIRDSCLVALQNKQTEFERYKAFNDRTVDYETLGLLAQKEIDIKEGLKVKAYEISVVKEKHDELVKQSLLTKSHYEGLVKEKTKVITDLKLKEEKDIDKMISMENQLKFLNEIVYKRSQSIQTIHMLAPKCPTFNGRPTFANPRVMSFLYLQSSSDLDEITELQCLYLHKVRECDCLAQKLSEQTEFIVQLILFIVDSGCTKHMTGNLSLLCNFVEKYLGTVRFGNDQFAPILGYGDLVQGNITIKRVYYVEGLNHNLFSVGQFCDADLEVAFRKSTCFVRDLQGNDLLTGNRGTDLYTISLQETTSSTPICLMAKASPTQAWLWHRRLSHLNFDYINLLSKKDVVIGLPKLKYVKDQLCSSCESPSPTANSTQQDTPPTINIHPTSEPSTPTNVDAEENNENQAEFTNPFCTSVQEHAESSSRNIGTSNMHTFNQPQDSKYRWTKDHPLTQVRGNPSKPVQTR
ncbi:retrovirus-related pol polyprotein from transposon TNT 1-94 [Tanacetum coccineum]